VLEEGSGGLEHGVFAGCGEFWETWPKKDMTQEERRLLAMASIGMGSAELEEFVALLAQNLG
jgi:hypothetical protein